MDAEQVQRVVRDYRDAGLDPARTALLDYCVKLTRTPGAMTEADVQRLRDHGFTDAEVYNAAMVTGYFNFINRIADGLGVDLEPEMPSPEGWPPCSW